MIVTRLPLTGATVAQPFESTRAGLPALDSIYDTFTFTAAAGGPTYEVLRTTEFDTYESHQAARAVAALLRQKARPSRAALQRLLARSRAGGPVPKRPARRGPSRPAPAPPGAPALSDNFAGTARKAAKLSIASGATEPFADLRDLVGSLVADNSMINHKPAISTAATSGRVKEEQRNVRLTGFLYAASREADNDFHLIVGRDPSSAPEMYMTMEVSGLPPAASRAFQALKGTRDAYQAFFKAQLPQMTYDFYHPPIPVVVVGSLFFDMTHALGQHPGPPSLKSRMPTIWEVHPVTSIVLGP